MILMFTPSSHLFVVLALYLGGEDIRRQQTSRREKRRKREILLREREM